MILESEIIEQIGDEPRGRPLPWVLDLIASLDPRDPVVILRGMWTGGHLTLVNDEGDELQRWRCEEIFRAGRRDRGVGVVPTQTGLAWVHGS